MMYGLYFLFQVQDQFQATYEEGNKLEEAYIMGNRLIKFLSEVLPTHQHYYSKHPEFTKLRIKTQNNLLKVRKQIDDISYAFDKEIYKNVMEMQGLEFELSPGSRKNGKKGRRKKVTFALEENENHNSRQQDQGRDCATKINGQIYVTPKRPSKGGGKGLGEKGLETVIGSNEDCDLAMWETQDPGLDFLDWSFSSGETSMSIEELSATEATTTSTPKEQTRIEKHDGFNLSQEFEDNVFDSMDDDGWKSFNGKSGGNFEWPEDPFQHSSNDLDAIFDQDDQNTSPKGANLSKSDPSIGVTEIDGADNDSLDSYESESDDDDDVYSGLEDVVENESFVEKIARENSFCGINDLIDEEDDSDAADSWEQNEEEEEDDEEEQEEEVVTPVEEDARNHNVMSLSIEEVRGMDDLETEEHLVTLHQEFISSFDGEDDDDSECDYCIEDEEHKRYVKNMTAMEFPDELQTCDSSGADKTVITAGTSETEALTADDDSDGSQSTNSEVEEKPKISISRREGYYQSFDGPQRNNNIELPDKLDYLEYKVKDLQVKNENKVKSLSSNDLTKSCYDREVNSASTNPSPTNLSKLVQESSYPIQMARSESAALELTRCRANKCCDHFIEPVTVTENVASPVRESSSRPYPTAARIKNLKKSAAWKRRYGTNTSQ